MMAGGMVFAVLPDCDWIFHVGFFCVVQKSTKNTEDFLRQNFLRPFIG